MKGSKKKRSASQKAYFSAYPTKQKKNRIRRIERHLKLHPEDEVAQHALKNELPCRSGAKRKGTRTKPVIINFNKWVAKGVRANKIGSGVHKEKGAFITYDCDDGVMIKAGLIEAPHKPISKAKAKKLKQAKYTTKKAK